MRIERDQHNYQPPTTGLWLLQGLVLLLFIILCSRFWYLQILRGEEFTQLAEANQTRIEKIFASRGIIFDRNYTKLAKDNLTFDITIIREDVTNAEVTIALISSILGLDKNLLMKTYTESSKKRTRFEHTLVLSDITFEQVAKIESNMLFLPGVSIQTNARRFYPEADAFAHILGYVAEASEKDMDKNEELAFGDIVGRQGLELVFEDTLRGTKGEYRNRRDVLGKVLAKSLEKEPETGENIILSLDADLQHKIIEIMGEYSGSVVVMDPYNGQLHAMVTLPSYDNNLFVRGFSHQQWSEVINDFRTPLQNRTIQSVYPPGSVWKIMMAALFLQEGIDPEEEVYCPGYMKYGNNISRCWRDGGHGHMSMEEALQNSCDVYFYDLGVKTGIDKISAFAQLSGFGHKSGIDIPNENGGLVPSKEWKLRRYGEKWQGGETLNVSIGQGQVLVTPLQVAVYISSLLNGGKILKPQVLFTEVPEVINETPSTAEHRELLQQFMVATVEDGTARVLNQKNPEIIVGGKTGTAQVAKLQFDGNRRLKTHEMEFYTRDHAWISAFVKYKNRDFVIVTMVEHGGGGSSVAGPVTRDVIKYMYRDVLETEEEKK